MNVSDCMRREVFTVKTGTSLFEAMRLMGTQMIGTVPVIDDNRHLVGVLLLADVLTQFMPRFVQVLDSTDFVHDFGRFEMGPPSSALLGRSLADLMRPPFSLAEDSGLMQAMVYMHNHRVNDVPVVDRDKRLVGIVSRMRVGSVFLMDWLNKMDEGAHD